MTPFSSLGGVPYWGLCQSFQLLFEEKKMGTNLHQVLRSLCFNTHWNYAIFWKLKHRARMYVFVVVVVVIFIVCYSLVLHFMPYILHFFLIGVFYLPLFWMLTTQNMLKCSKW